MENAEPGLLSKDGDGGDVADADADAEQGEEELPEEDTVLNAENGAENVD